MKKMVFLTLLFFSTHGISVAQQEKPPSKRPSDSITDSKQTNPTTDPFLKAIARMHDPAKIRPQLQRRCAAADKVTAVFYSLFIENAGDVLQEILDDERWPDVPDNETQAVTDYLNAMVERDLACSALQLDRGQKGAGLAGLNDLTDLIDRRDGWKNWLKEKEVQNSFKNVPPNCAPDALAKGRIYHLRNMDDVAAFACKYTDLAAGYDKLVKQYNDLVGDYNKSVALFDQLAAAFKESLDSDKEYHRQIEQLDRNISFPPMVIYPVPPVEPPQELHCISQTFGNSVYTDCH